MKKNGLIKYRSATVIAIIFHIVGLVGILGYQSDLVIRLTPVNLLLCFVLLVWTQKSKTIYFYFFLAACVILGFLFEVIGVNTGYLFGNYKYGDVLGYKLWNTPLIIGVNWFIIIFCTGISTHTLLQTIVNRLSPGSSAPPKLIHALSIMVDGATLATIFDWIMEPVAVKLGFWTWLDGEFVPLYNYFCWFLVSLLLLGLFHLFQFRKKNKFAVNLFLIQLMFFFILKVFLKK
jgi:bisanhydrobacterioruberin hydratase